MVTWRTKRPRPWVEAARHKWDPQHGSTVRNMQRERREASRGLAVGALGRQRQGYGSFFPLMFSGETEARGGWQRPLPNLHSSVCVGGGWVGGCVWVQLTAPPGPGSRAQGCWLLLREPTELRAAGWEDEQGEVGASSSGMFGTLLRDRVKSGVQGAPGGRCQEGVCWRRRWARGWRGRSAACSWGYTLFLIRLSLCPAFTLQTGALGREGDGHAGRCGPGCQLRPRGRSSMGTGSSGFQKLLAGWGLWGTKALAALGLALGPRKTRSSAGIGLVCRAWRACPRSFTHWLVGWFSKSSPGTYYVPGQCWGLGTAGTEGDRCLESPGSRGWCSRGGGGRRAQREPSVSCKWRSAFSVFMT